MSMESMYLSAGLVLIVFGAGYYIYGDGSYTVFRVIAAPALGMGFFIWMMVNPVLTVYLGIVLAVLLWRSRR